MTLICSTDCEGAVFSSGNLSSDCGEQYLILATECACLEVPMDHFGQFLRDNLFKLPEVSFVD